MKPVQVAPPRAITDRTAQPAMRLHGRDVQRGAELTVTGIRGRVRFVQHVRHDNGAEWVDVIVERTGRSRTVRPDAIRTVHRKP